MSSNRTDNSGRTASCSLGSILEELAGLLCALSARAACDGEGDVDGDVNGNGRGSALRRSGTETVEVWGDDDYLYVEGRHRGRPLEVDVSMLQGRIFVRARVLPWRPESPGPNPSGGGLRKRADALAIARLPAGSS
jgi:hypothetical protein